MKNAYKYIGTYGEKVAFKYLKKNGFTIWDKNWSAPPSGEIDIIAAYQDELIFIEVKTSLKYSKHYPAIDRIDKNKQEKLKLLASHYIHSFRSEYLQYNVKRLRFDGISVCLGNIKQKEAILNHHKSPF